MFVGMKPVLVEARVEAIPKPLQVQVQEATPKIKRVTHSSMKKGSTIKSKSTITTDLEVAKDPPMVDNVLES